MKNKINTVLLVAVTVLLAACNNKPKVITSTSENKGQVEASGIFSEDTNAPAEISSNKSQAFGDDLHTVVINEVLPAEKYVYLNVTEGAKQFWIATGKKEVNIGETYFYKGGLLKTNFESKEYNRVFETVYLVTNLVAQKHGDNTGKINISDYTEAKEKTPVKVAIETHTDKVVQHQGSIKIAELVKDPKKYEGKTIQLSGICTKINAGIMNRNWIHIKDGSKDDFDLVITSQEFVPEGSSFTIKALVTLNKDFGAGYRYDLILENGLIIK